MASSIGPATPIIVCVFDSTGLAGRDAGASALLDDAERARADRLLSPGTARRWAMSRAFLRCVAAARSGRPPSALRFRTAFGGKPTLAPHPGAPHLCFNLSHSGPHTAVAITEHRAVGVDIEAIDHRASARLVAALAFTRLERAAIDRLPEDARLRAFYACWVRKEAVIKAHGDPVAVPLDAFRVSVGTAEPPRIEWSSTPTLAPTDWCLADLPLGEGVAGAVAVRRLDARETFDLRLRVVSAEEFLNALQKNEPIAVMT